MPNPSTPADRSLRPPYALATLPALDTHDLAVTGLLYGPDVPVVQLIWPDEHHRFPWDVGYSYPVDAQPLSGILGDYAA